MIQYHFFTSETFVCLPFPGICWPLECGFFDNIEDISVRYRGSLHLPSALWTSLHSGRLFSSINHQSVLATEGLFLDFYRKLYLQINLFTNREHFQFRKILSFSTNTMCTWNDEPISHIYEYTRRLFQIESFFLNRKYLSKY